MIAIVRQAHTHTHKWLLFKKIKTHVILGLKSHHLRQRYNMTTNKSNFESLENNNRIVKEKSTPSPKQTKKNVL